jgi:Spy/CpxP family protein refolding chaperone
MTKSIAFVFATSMLFITTACDPADADDPVTERSAEVQSDPDAEEPDGDHDKRGDHAKFVVDKLCSELECTEAQATKIAEVFAKKHEKRDDKDREAHEVARAEANKALAAAFRADVFDASVLDRHKPDRDGDHESKMITLTTELHAILTPEQRAKLADKVQQDGPLFFIGKRGHDKHGESRPDKAEGPHGDPAERVAQHVSHLCEKVTCTPEQQAQLTQALTAAHEARHAAKDQRSEPDFSAVAALLRADTLDAAKLTEALEAGKAEHEQRKVERDKAFGAIVGQVHAILTPEQRAIVADLIEDKGVHALMGGRHGKHDKRGKGRHDKRD